MIDGSILDGVEPTDDRSTSPQSTITPHIVPDPNSSDRQCARFNHWDIEGLEDSELADEWYALRPILWRLPHDDWRRERAAVLKNEARRRGKRIENC